MAGRSDLRPVEPGLPADRRMRGEAVVAPVVLRDGEGDPLARRGAESAPGKRRREGDVTLQGGRADRHQSVEVRHHAQSSFHVAQDRLRWGRGILDAGRNGDPWHGVLLARRLSWVQRGILLCALPDIAERGDLLTGLRVAEGRTMQADDKPRQAQDSARRSPGVIWRQTFGDGAMLTLRDADHAFREAGAGRDRTMPQAGKAAARGGPRFECAACGFDLVARLRHRFGPRLDVRQWRHAPADVVVIGHRTFVERPSARPGRMWPVAVIALAPTEEYAAALLLAGADDVIDERWSDALVLARLRALARRRPPFHFELVRCGRWDVDFEAERAVSDCGREVCLTRMETRLLRYLIAARGEIVPSTFLTTRVFGYAPGTLSHTLETHIYRLRKKLEAHPRRPALILSVPGGYRIAEDFRKPRSACA